MRQTPIVSFSDLAFLIKRSKRYMLYGGVCGAFLLLIYAITRPVEYEANASFREQSRGPAGISNSSITSLLSIGSSNANASEAISMMKSRKLQEELISKLGLQARLEKKQIHFDLLSRVRDNLLVEFAHLIRRQEPILRDGEEAISVRNVDYSGSTYTQYKIKFLDDSSYQFSDKEGNVAVALLGQPVKTKLAEFTLTQESVQPLAHQEFTLVLIPMYTVLQGLSDKLVMEVDKDDRQLVRLKYSCRNCPQATTLLDSLMDVYQAYLKAEQQRILLEQINYLNARQDRMQEKLQDMMEAHATTLASEAVSTGFLNSEKAMEFLADHLQQYTQQLIAIDLEYKQLAHVQSQGPDNFERLAAKDQQSPIEQILSKIRLLKQQSDSLDLVLREAAATDHAAAEESFRQDSAELEKIQQLSQEAQVILASVEKGNLPHTGYSLYHEPKYMVGAWCKKLAGTQEGSEERSRCQDNFISYLSNLNHLFQVHTKAIKERLTHQQNAQQEYQGLDLATAQELYIDYSKQKNAIEALLLQHQFITEKMQAPDFEMSALSAILTDAVSRDMIADAAEAMLALKDQNNRSSKEQERLKQEIEVQKGFLTAHLKETIELQEIQRKLLDDKIRALQSATLVLTQQEISVLQEHLADYIKSRMEHLLQERGVIMQHQRELKQEMAQWPTQWVSEMLIEQQMEINKKMVEEITKLVETKNITSNLEVVRSAPIDLAITPPHPKSPRLLLFMIFGAFLGAFAPYVWMVVRSLTHGIPVSSENLKMSNYHVAGPLSNQVDSESTKPLLDNDLETLRHVANFLELSSAQTSLEKTDGLMHQRALLLTGQGPDYAKELAKLLSKKGLRSLVLSLNFDSQGPSNELPGLLQYLENQAAQPTIVHCPGFDRIAPGGISRYSSELLGKQSFLDLLTSLQNRYDWVLAVSNVSLNSAEAESILQHFPYASMTITRESWTDIAPCLSLKKKLTFIVQEDLS